MTNILAAQSGDDPTADDDAARAEASLANMNERFASQDRT